MPGRIPTNAMPTARWADGSRPELLETARMPPGPAVTPTPDAAAPKQLGPYKVLARLGAGGMGVVFRAFDTTLDRPVALKVLRPDLRTDHQARTRFLREAKAAAAVRDDHVITTFQVGEEAGVPFMAMELLQGSSLDDYLMSNRSLPLADILRIGRETALGLASAHMRGLVHRDIKPSNLWLEIPGGRIKILDFGLALPTGDVERLTSTGVVLGTPAYMSPEQARDDAIDHRSDLFSLGAVLYRIATGRLPFQGANTLAVLTALAVDTPPAIQSLVPDIPEPFAALVNQLLAKRPADRPQSAAEVAQRIAAIEAALSAPQMLPVPSPSPSPQPTPPSDWRSLVQLPPAEPPPPRRSWLPTVAIIVAMLAGTAAIVRVVDPEGKAVKDLWAELRGGSDGKGSPEADWSGPERVYWRRLDGKGHIEKIGRGHWLEYTTERAGGPFKLTETSADSDYVYLFDPSRQRALRVSADRMEAMDASEQWQWTTSGTWSEPPRGKTPPPPKGKFSG
ncbi:MAG: serine/threonine-protein kinase [Gemmataceae bacterium]